MSDKPQKKHQVEISEKVELVRALLGESPIAFHRPLGKIAGSAGAGLFLSQLLYWSNKVKDENGWLYKTQQEWTDETCLRRGEQEAARKIWKDMKILEEEARGIPCKLFYRINFDMLAASFAQPARAVENIFPTTADGWKKILPELLQAAIWEYKSSGKPIKTTAAKLSITISNRINRLIEETGAPSEADLETLKAFRACQARLKKKDAEEKETIKREANKKPTENETAKIHLKKLKASIKPK